MADAIPDLPDSISVQNEAYRDVDQSAYVAEADSGRSDKFFKLIKDLDLIVDEASFELIGVTYNKDGNGLNYSKEAMAFMKADGGDTLADNIRKKMSLKIETDKLLGVDVPTLDVYELDALTDFELIKRFANENKGLDPTEAIAGLSKTVGELDVELDGYKKQKNLAELIREEDRLVYSLQYMSESDYKTSVSRTDNQIVKDYFKVNEGESIEDAIDGKQTYVDRLNKEIDDLFNQRKAITLGVADPVEKLGELVNTEARLVYALRYMSEDSYNEIKSKSPSVLASEYMEKNGIDDIDKALEKVGKQVHLLEKETDSLFKQRSAITLGSFYSGAEWQVEYVEAIKELKKLEFTQNRGDFSDKRFEELSDVAIFNTYYIMQDKPLSLSDVRAKIELIRDDNDFGRFYGDTSGYSSTPLLKNMNKQDLIVDIMTTGHKNGLVSDDELRDVKELTESQFGYITSEVRSGAIEKQYLIEKHLRGVDPVLGVSSKTFRNVSKDSFDYLSEIKGVVKDSSLLKKNGLDLTNKEMVKTLVSKLKEFDIDSLDKGKMVETLGRFDMDSLDKDEVVDLIVDSMGGEVELKKMYISYEKSYEKSKAEFDLNRDDTFDYTSAIIDVEKSKVDAVKVDDVRNIRIKNKL